MGLLLGGAVGNLTDRLMQGYVTDFISVGSFPVFNVARETIYLDMVAAASVGVLAAIFPMWRAVRVGIAEGLRRIG